jgi:hypothetical protein
MWHSPNECLQGVAGWRCSRGGTTEVSTVVAERSTFVLETWGKFYLGEQFVDDQV